MFSLFDDDEDDDDEDDGWRSWSSPGTMLLIMFVLLVIIDSAPFEPLIDMPPFCDSDDFLEYSLNIS